jgi:hypothetical protein
MLYNTLVLPHIDYCSTVWGCTSQNNIMRIQRLQNRAMRPVLRKGPCTHIEDMLHELKWLGVKQRIDFNRMVLMWKIINGAAPCYLSDKLKYSHEVHSYNTIGSSNNNIYIPLAHKYSIYKLNASMWNALPSEVRDINVFATFKCNLKFYVQRHFRKF